MVSKDGIHTVRIARFLKPLVESVNQGSSHSIFVWKFLRKQAEMAIRCSVGRLEHAPETMGRMLDYWCPETNTLVFPWGEATITLEDIVNLVGLPVLREQIRVFALRLSRFVLPSLPEHTIQKHDFAIAIHLSEGTKIALAPAVLASLRKNLRLLKEQAAAAASGSITVSGPLQIVQLWAFERFPLLGPQCPNLLKHGEPRAARWHKLNSKISLPLTRSVLKVPDNFKWLPYADNLDKRHHSSYYREDDL
ncbi:PREDICTED: uncharacterized protein LOC105136556 [Populus euphratica]|uniref:Uncharacterized protein LOC105136556 n=1 Tax=Populus euphratica TaxID=75702 RepID=A0AAJ6V3B5_POPEU|nr:PREDICTED: uncharacterized protein LOC105136556 [Populus euphratica]